MTVFTWDQHAELQQHIDATVAWVERAWAKQAQELREQVAHLRQEARAAVDRELHEHGYDSLRFADYRAGWLSLEVGLSQLFPEKS